MGLASLCLRRRKQDFFLTSRGDTVRMKYSSLLQIVKHADYTVVTIRNPWDTLKVLHTYLLADREKPLPEHLPEGTVVRTPLQKSVIYSSVHCSLWSELDELKGIGGVCGLEYIKLPQIQEAAGTEALSTSATA